jgi:hypothetical protein
MGYTISLNEFFKSEDMLDALCTDRVTISNVQEYWDLDVYTELSEDEIISLFKDSTYYYDFLYSKVPMLHYGHVLATKDIISYDDLELVQDYTSVNVWSIDELDVHVLTLTGCGVDMSDQLELAYLIIDGWSPIKSNDTNPTLERYREKRKHRTH